jgi:hypothetical protein
MNVRRFTTSFIAVFIVFGVLEYLIHMRILAGLYEANADLNLWRPMDEWWDRPGWLGLSGAIFVGAFCLIFDKGYEGKGLMEGVRYGSLVATLLTGIIIGFYVFMPIPLTLVGCWTIAVFLESITAGVVLAKLRAD